MSGDGAATARAVSLRVGIGDRVGSAKSLRNGAGVAAEDYEVFAGVFPDDKFRLVEALQRQGHVVGMTGDGVNDTTSLKQASRFPQRTMWPRPPRVSSSLRAASWACSALSKPAAESINAC